MIYIILHYQYIPKFPSTDFFHIIINILYIIKYCVFIFNHSLYYILLPVIIYIVCALYLYPIPIFGVSLVNVNCKQKINKNLNYWTLLALPLSFSLNIFSSVLFWVILLRIENTTKHSRTISIYLYCQYCPLDTLIINVYRSLHYFNPIMSVEFIKYSIYILARSKTLRCGSITFFFLN